MSENGPAPEGPEIPVLERRERERRGGAVPWYARFLPAGGSPAPASSWLGGLLATKMGLAAGAGILLASAAAGAVLYQRFSAPPAADTRRPALEGVSGGGPLVKKPKDRSIDYLSNANQGEIVFEPAAPERAAAPQPPAAPEAPPERRTEQEKSGKTPAQPPGLAELLAHAGKSGGLKNDSFARKLTKNTSELHGGRFNGGQGYGNFQKLAMKRGGAGNPPPEFQPKSALSSMARGRSSLKVGAKSTGRVKASSARGQLAFAKTMSAKGMTSGGAEAGAQYSSDAFDQQTTQGGASGASGVGIGPDATAPPMGGGAADVTSAGAKPATQGYMQQQPLMDQAAALNEQAQDDKMMAIMFMILGVALIAIGYAITQASFGLAGPIGVLLILLGLAMIALSVKQMIESGNKSDEAARIGQQIKDDYDQEAQGQAVQDCTAHARAGGDYDACMADTRAPEGAMDSHVPDSPPADAAPADAQTDAAAEPAGR